MILAAGLGTRLGDITLKKPKALVEVQGTPMLHRLLIHLRQEGIEQVCINVHHFADQIIESIRKENNFGLDICFSDEKSELLDTGGALLAAKDFFTGKEPILIHNADILTNLNFRQLHHFHVQNKAAATLFVSGRNSSRALLFDKQKQLTGWTNHTTGEFKWVSKPMTDFSAQSFNGVWLSDPEFIHQIPFTGKFSIIDAWLTMAKENRILGFQEDDCAWFDLGTSNKIAAAASFLNKKQ